MPAKSHLFNRAPRWKNHYYGLQAQPPAELFSWLHESGSLTKRLRGLYGQDFKVTLLFNRWKPAFNDECRLLDLPPARYQLIREVLLHAAGQPLILARTVLPAATIEIAHRNLSHLGNRPLGEVIFSYPDLGRHRRQFCRSEYSDWSPSLSATVDMPEVVWGRRTVYTIQKHPLLVAEFFLPALTASSISQNHFRSRI